MIRPLAFCVGLTLAWCSTAEAQTTSERIDDPLSGNFDVGLALYSNPETPPLDAGPLVGGKGPIIIELTGAPLPNHVEDKHHAMIEIDGMFPGDTRCLVSYRDVCVIRGHRLEIK